MCEFTANHADNICANQIQIWRELFFFAIDHRAIPMRCLGSLAYESGRSCGLCYKLQMVYTFKLLTILILIRLSQHKSRDTKYHLRESTLCA